MKRVFLVVLDSFGIGMARDASFFGDGGAFTLESVYKTGRAKLDNLRSLGLFNIHGLSFFGATESPKASYARVREASNGKDTTIGHWEIAGHISKSPLPTFKNGFPKEFMDAFSKKIGRGLLCNKPYSGTAVIKDYGEEHIKNGDLIVYTSGDSVFQLAAHVDYVPLDTLYEYCKIARSMLVGELGVGRVIARPFAGTAPDFYRTPDRHDYSLEPPVSMLTDEVKKNGLDSIAVGKINDIFAARGFTRTVRTRSNDDGMRATEKLICSDFTGLCFINLVDFDSLWGHRRDPIGYAEGLNSFDLWLGKILPMLSEDDTLIICADHGCDPSFMATTDHTREDIPLLIYSKSIAPKDLGIRDTFADIGATVAKLLKIDFSCDGRAMDI